jgi:diguanylate cyclase (GGDEF)-like protein
MMEVPPPLRVSSPGRNRFQLMLAALLLAGISAVSLLSFLRARALLDRQITTSTLPLTSDAIISSLEHDLLQPVLVSGVMAGNTLLEDALRDAEVEPQKLSLYLREIQQRSGAITTFLVSDATRRYYHPSGVLKQVSPSDPQDRWYFRFRNTAQAIEINIDRDTADLSRTTAFINVRLQDAGGRFLGVTGLGLDLRSLEKQLRHYQKQYGARILLVDRGGKVVLSSDGSGGRLEERQDLKTIGPRLLEQRNTNLRLRDRGKNLYIRATRIAEIGWTLVLIQTRSADQSAIIALLTQNLLVAVLISGVLFVLAQFTLGRDRQRLETIAQTDNLSGLLNRQVFEPLFHQLSAQAQRSGEPLALALLDLDHFKQVNDRHGHLIGDAVIRHVSQRLITHVREADPLFRWGGEEFLLLMPGCSLQEAERRLDAIRADLLRHPLELENLRGELAVTLSIGLTLYEAGEASLPVLQRADQALYAAKHAGRDRICVHTAPALS